MLDKEKIEEIREDIKDVLDLIETAIAAVELEAKNMHCDPIALRTPEGGWVMHTLWESKIRAYNNLLMIDLLEATHAEG